VADVDLHGDTLNGKRLMDLGLTARGLVVTRIRRQGREIVPRGDVRLLYGDIVRVVGEPEAVRQFAREAHGGGANGGHSPAHAETSMLPFLLGLLLGVALGTLPIPLPGGGSVQISAAGGVFLVSLVIGYGGRVGPLALRVPPAAQVLSRELGLMLFLAGAGSRAGEKFAEVLAQYGVLPLLAGAAVTTAAAAVGVVLMHFVFRMNVLAIMGGLCACFTNPAALAAASKRTDTDLPALAYASIYPVALIVKIVLAQILVALGP